MTTQQVMTCCMNADYSARIDAQARTLQFIYVANRCSLALRRRRERVEGSCAGRKYPNLIDRPACCGCPLRWHKKLRHYSQLAESFYADSGPVLQNECRLAKQRRALQECTWPRNNQPETHRDDEPGSGGFAAPWSIASHRVGRFSGGLEKSM